MARARASLDTELKLRMLEIHIQSEFNSEVSSFLRSKKSASSTTKSILTGMYIQTELVLDRF